MPGPITQYVLKVHSRCDLACDHCYVYRHADQSWRRKPPAITVATVRKAAVRIAEHAAAHGLTGVLVVLHGGEPLLLGPYRLRAVLNILRDRITRVTGLDVRVHTNGVLLDERLCDLFAEFGVKVGISLDGDRAANDRHRRFADGRSSHREVRRALALLRRPVYRHLYAGILCTIDLGNDPIAVYEALLAERPPRLDLLLPHATWERPPPRDKTSAPYADWLSKIHSRWIADGRPMPIRIFDSISAAARGEPVMSEALGLDSVDLVVIDTDGSWEQADSLKTAFDGAAATGLHVDSHSVEEAAAHPGIAARQGNVTALCRTCRACPVVKICGGGLYAHRYSAENGFDNPSVYCADLKALIARVTAPRKTPTAPPKAVAVPPVATPRHVLPQGAFESLSAGPGTHAAAAALAEMRLSLTRALVAAVAGREDAGGEFAEVAREGWALLSQLDRDHPDAVAEVLTHPYTYAWAVRCLRPPPGADTALDRAHLAGVAAAAALRAGVSIDMALSVRDDTVYLPALGALRVDGGARRSIRVSLASGRLVTRHGGAKWLSLRRVSGGPLSVVVDDVDAFRDCHAWPVTGRLDAATWRGWKQALATAGAGLARELPAYADALAAGVRTVVPLRPAPARHRRGSTAPQAFGAVAVALPPGSGTLGPLIVHGFQHAKLNALLDMYDFFDDPDGRHFPVPWRAGLRPIEGLLRDGYAYLAVAELWRSRLRVRRTEEAADLFSRYRSWVREAIDTLLAAKTLTENGNHFVSGMRETVEGWTE